jgi:hypothetical protein
LLGVVVGYLLLGVVVGGLLQSKNYQPYL